jgi:ADP-heptose:LPS heptosyltransferase
MPLAALAPLADLPGVSLVSLQKGPGAEQLREVAFRDRVLDLGEELDPGSGAFLDTAAVLASLDLVISSDTSIAHLAGALARPTWVALNASPDWRWLLDRTDSPWYPTMRLFRQSGGSGGWDPVVADLGLALASFAAQRSR